MNNNISKTINKEGEVAPLNAMSEKPLIITADDFKRYEGVRLSGITNMFNATMVCKLSGLSQDKVFKIMKEYVALEKQFKAEVNLSKVAREQK